jgi:hypothetical protein
VINLTEVHYHFVVEVETSVLYVEPLAASHLRSANALGYLALARDFCHLN